MKLYSYNLLETKEFQVNVILYKVCDLNDFQLICILIYFKVTFLLNILVYLCTPRDLHLSRFKHNRPIKLNIIYNI